MRRIACALFLFPALLAAETLDFDQAQKFALTHSPVIQAAYSSIGQARGRLLQAGLWPNPEIDLSYRADLFSGGQVQDKAMASLMQRFPWSGRLARAQKVSRVEVAIALSDVRDAERKLILEVQRMFIQARAAAEKAAALKKLSSSMDSLIALNEAGLQAGQTSAMAVNLAKVEREGLRQQLLSLEADEEAALAALKGSLGITGAQTLNLSGSLAEIISRLKSAAGTKKLYRPDLVRAALEADAAAAEIALARSEVWEDVTVGVEYEFMRTLDGPDLMNENFLGARVILPLPVWNRNQGNIAEKTAGRERAGRELEAAKRGIESEIAAARVRASKTSSIATLISKDSLPLLDETRGVLESSIRTGQANTTEAITLTNQEINQRLFYVDSLMNQAQALSEMEAALGSNRHLNRDIFTNALHDNKPPAKH
ncbi:MAG: TolC family protein [Verrucomicrobia bacterium]|nr:TolC family protein [Verrucomicrobiota bacterium]